MRSTLLTRSVVAVASLAIGSVALAATPATAATPSGVTREAVLSLAASARANAVDVAVASDILIKECKLETGQSFGSLFPPKVTAIAPNSVVEGVVMTGTVNSSNAPSRECVVGLVTPKAANSVLAGTAKLTVVVESSSATPTPQETILSGDVSTTTILEAAPLSVVTGTTYVANGTATTTITSTTTETVKTSKTTAEKKAAKKTYTKRLASAKKAYKKAIAKAGKSKTKKAAAKKKYKAKKAAAKKAYLRAIAPRVTTIPKTTSTPSSSTFAVSATSGN